MVQRRLEHVEVDFLRHDADAGLGRLELAVDVVAEHAAPCRAVLLTSEVMMPIRVVLPAPLGPSSAKKSPCSTSRSTPLQRLHAVPVGLGESAYRECIHGREGSGVARASASDRAHGARAAAVSARRGARTCLRRGIDGRRPRAAFSWRSCSSSAPAVAGTAVGLLVERPAVAAARLDRCRARCRPGARRARASSRPPGLHRR